MTYRLQGLLDLVIQCSSLDGNDFGGDVRVVSDGRTAFGAKDAMDGMAGGALTSPGFGGAGKSECFFGDDCYQCFMMLVFFLTPSM